MRSLRSRAFNRFGGSFSRSFATQFGGSRSNWDTPVRWARGTTGSNSTSPFSGSDSMRGKRECDVDADFDVTWNGKWHESGHKTCKLTIDDGKSPREIYEHVSKFGTPGGRPSFFLKDHEGEWNQANRGRRGSFVSDNTSDRDNGADDWTWRNNDDNNNNNRGVSDWEIHNNDNNNEDWSVDSVGRRSGGSLSHAPWEWPQTRDGWSSREWNPRWIRSRVDDEVDNEIEDWSRWNDWNGWNNWNSNNNWNQGRRWNKNDWNNNNNNWNNWDQVRRWNDRWNTWNGRNGWNRSGNELGRNTNNRNARSNNNNTNTNSNQTDRWRSFGFGSQQRRWISDSTDFDRERRSSSSNRNNDGRESWGGRQLGRYGNDSNNWFSGRNTPRWLTASQTGTDYPSLTLGHLHSSDFTGASRGDFANLTEGDKVWMTPRKWVGAMLLALKIQNGVTFGELAKATGRSEVFVATALLGQHHFTKGEALAVMECLGIDAKTPEGKGVLLALLLPARGEPMSPWNPAVYRLYELIQMYGPSFKEIVNEKLGDCNFSATDAEVDFQLNKEGTRGRITFDIAIVPYRRF